MDLSGFMDSIISFAQNNTIIAIVLALGLLYFLYRKPKLFFVLLFLGLFLYGLFYMITSMGGSGAAQKKKIIQQEEKQAD
jgi:multisubunit Na+/H+ antiporter MnhC subunit